MAARKPRTHDTGVPEPCKFVDASRGDSGQKKTGGRVATADSRKLAEIITNRSGEPIGAFPFND
jgi:hypothetical protein